MIIWIVLIGIPLIFGMYAQYRVKSAYGKNREIQSRGHITGREAAEAVMNNAGIHDVEIVEVPGELSDHYDPSHKRLALSADIYRGTSLAALGIAAHESGHAIQHQVGYGLMKVRQTLVPAMQIAAPVSWFVLSIGIVLASVLGRAYFGMGMLMVEIGVVALSVVALFQLVTLPVEFDASRRAKVQLVNLGILDADEMPGVNETLDAAALTYVAAFVATLGNLLYLLLIISSGGRRNN